MDIKEYNIRVKLKATSSLSAKLRNPKIGTEYECAGTIIRASTLNIDEYIDKQTILNQIEDKKVPLPIPIAKLVSYLEVEWDNGYTNNYAGRSLLIINEAISQYKSIW